MVQYNREEHVFQTGDFYLPLSDSGRIALKLVYGKNSACPDSLEISFRVDHVRAGFEMQEYSCQLPVNLSLSDRSENAKSIKWIMPNGTERRSREITYTVSHTLSYSELYSHEINHLSFPFVLVATSPQGCRDTVARDFRVSLPVARLIPDKVSGCVPLSVAFSDSSRSIESIRRWSYVINQESFSHNSADPYTHTFEDPGTFEVRLAVENEFGCRDTSYPVTLYAGKKVNPSFKVFPDLICPGDSIRFDDSTMLQDSLDFRHYSSPGLFNDTWFGDSRAAVKVWPASAGYKPVRLEVGYHGCISDTLIQEAFRIKESAAGFQVSFSCDSPLVYTFISGVGEDASIEWKINDTLVPDADTVHYKFPNSGDFNVTLRVFNNATACVDSMHKIIRVRDVKALYTVDPVVCLGDSAKFNARFSKDYIDECFHEGFLWDFMDDSPPKRTFKTQYGHVYGDTGTFSPMLIVRDVNGCVDTLRRTLSVGYPEASFTADVTEGCASGLTVNFTKTSEDKGPVTWEWHFGDNTSVESSVISVPHNYTGSRSKTYQATLVVRDEYGCKHSVSAPISLFLPEVAFGADENFICAGGVVNFTAPYDEYDGFTWDFGDGTALSQALNHQYVAPGVFDVTLNVVKNGCAGSLTKDQYIIAEKADATFTVSDSIFDCYPATVIFNHLSGNSVNEGVWTFAPGMTSPEYRSSYQFNYSKPGLYAATLWINTVNNCSASYSRNVRINGPYAAFTFAPDSICYGDPVNFNILSSQDVNEFKWLFGDGETSTAASPTHNYRAKGIIAPALWVKNNDCEVTLTQELISVSDVTASFEIMDNKTVFCQLEELQVVNRSSGYQFITWNINNALVHNGPELPPFPLYLPGVMQIGLSALDALGCSDSVWQSITINPLPGFIIEGDTLVCSGVASSFQVSPANSGWSIGWHPPEGISDTASFNPVVTTDTTRQYTATVTDAYGCQASGNIRIRVEETPDFSRVPLQDTAIFIGETIELSVVWDNETAQYSWSPDNKISCRNCSNPLVSPENDITYTVTIRDECFTVTEQFPVEVIIDFYIETPDAFSPNNDGINDVFIPETKNIREFKEFKIYNRWGNLVFETNRLDEGWDGTTNGKMQHTDTYAFYIRAVSEHGYETEKKGNFLLLK
jgi:gliding motility-associated-like protein